MDKCPTCEQLMEQVGEGVFWCPHCGTLRDLAGRATRMISVPALVTRVRRMREKHNYNVDTNGVELEKLERDVDEIVGDA